MADLYFLVCGVAALYIGLSETSRQNLPLNMPLLMRCNYKWNGRAVRVVDGNNDTCFGSSSELVVDLLALYHIEDINIHTKEKPVTGHGAIQTSNFIRVPGGRSFYTVVKSSALSRVSCVQQCMLSGTCVGVRYNRGSRECQLLTPRSEPTHTANPDSVYYKDGRQTYC